MPTLNTLLGPRDNHRQWFKRFYPPRGAMRIARHVVTGATDESQFLPNKTKMKYIIRKKKRNVAWNMGDTEILNNTFDCY